MDDKHAKSSKSLRITKVYTRTGDKGMTRLVGGQQVPKDHPRLCAYGTLDELQVCIGLAIDTIHETLAAHPDSPLDVVRSMTEHLAYVQNQLFTASGDLATRIEDRWEGMPLLAQADIDFLEEVIDAFNAPLPPLKDFILPGGSRAVTALHLCRVVCRRAEREAEALAAVEPVGEMIRPFINRLSDYFFVLGRRLAQELCQLELALPEIIWKRQLPRPNLPK